MIRFRPVHTDHVHNAGFAKYLPHYRHSRRLPSSSLCTEYLPRSSEAVMCANLGGDTDTIGAMATAICGAFTGYSKINPEYTELLRVQNSETDFDEYINILKKGRELAGCGR